MAIGIFFSRFTDDLLEKYSTGIIKMFLNIIVIIDLDFRQN
ncbi:hypothetical protein [Okeania sp. SIO2B3]|nr:hypothetical protein [Okeania sp. SIO2B3]